MRSLVIALSVIPILITGPSTADDTGGTSEDSIWVEDVRNSHDQGWKVPSLPDGYGPALQPVSSSSCGDATEVTEQGLQSTITFCAESHSVDRSITAGDVRRAFQELALPAGELVIQPPDGLTLVNFATNFYTTSTAPISRTVTLLEQQVTLEATPGTFIWHFGDGEAVSTTEPGAPYPLLDVTHRYTRTGTYEPRLATTYTGRYRIGDGAWRAIPGTVTIVGAGRPLRVVEARPTLVGP